MNDNLTIATTGKKLLPLLLFAGALFAVTTAYAQYHFPQNNVWPLPYHIGINFNSGSPVAMTTATSIGGPEPGIGSESCAAICDGNGQLLFYTDGSDVWNKNHVMMPNGNNLTGQPGYYFVWTGTLMPATASTSQGAVIVPVSPGSTRYYVFSLSQTEQGGSNAGKLYYSIVDMSLNNGLGDVETNNKGKLIDTALTEGLNPVKADGCNVWLLAHSRDTSMFCAYKVTPAGIDAAVKSYAGTYAFTLGNGATGKNMYYVPGVIKASPDGMKVAATYGSLVELYDFDATTGIVSNAIRIDTLPAGYNVESQGFYGACFSPDNSKLYISSYGMYQYNVSLSTEAAIKASKTELVANKTYSQMRLGPDGKIYFRGGGGVMHTSMMCAALGAINSPNVAGTACGYDDSVLVFTGTNNVINLGFPNDLIIPPADTSQSVALDTAICPTDQIVLNAPGGFTGYEWDDGGTGTTRTVTAGRYWLRSRQLCYVHVDTFVVKNHNIPPVVITVNDFLLGTAGSYVSYQWYRDGQPVTGATNATFTVTQNGIYTVSVVDINGCTDSSAGYEVTNVSVGNLVVENGKVNIYPNPAPATIHIETAYPARFVINTIDGKVMLQGNTNIPVDVGGISAGLYIIQLYDNAGNCRHVAKFVKE